MVETSRRKIWERSSSKILNREEFIKEWERKQEFDVFIDCFLPKIEKVNPLLLSTQLIDVKPLSGSISKLFYTDVV